MRFRINMIIKLDGIHKEFNSGKKSEDEFDVVRLKIHRNRVYIDVNITPIFCENCKKQLPCFYYLGGSRYGQVGEVECDYCKTKIFCSDSDNIVEYLRTNGIRMDYYQLYKLDNETWDKLKEKTGYDIYCKGLVALTPLNDVMNEICEYLNLKSIKEDHSHGIITNDRITNLPKLINKWLYILNYLELD
jgi:hypothetical protein